MLHHSDRVDHQAGLHQFAEQQDQYGCKYLPQEESTIRHGACPPPAAASPQHPPRFSVHHEPYQGAQGPKPKNKAMNGHPAVPRYSQIPSNPPNPTQNISPQAGSPAARTESTHPCREISPPPKWKRNPRSGTLLAQDGSDPSR